MRTALLTALLLSAPSASAQDTAAPPASAPAPVSAGAATLTLSARPGTLADFTLRTGTRLTLEDVQVTAADGGAGPGEAELTELRRGIEEALGRAGTQVSVGKVFYRVGERTPGGVPLLSTVVTEVPGQGPLTVRGAWEVAPDGTVTLTRLESDNPLVQSALSGLSPETLRGQTSANGIDLAGLYGRAFAVGQPVTRTDTVDVQALLGSLLGTLGAGAGGGQNPFGEVRATPLRVTTTTTYRGVNPAGLHVFETRSTTGDWTLELGGTQAGGGAALPRIRLDLLGGSPGGGLSLYRPDGLPVGSTQTQALRLRVGLTLPGGEQMSMLVRLDQTVTLRPR